MKTYTFYYETDCSLHNQPVQVEAHRLNIALNAFLCLVFSRADFSSLTVFNYRITSNGKSQNRHLDHPHHYVSVKSGDGVSFKFSLTN